MQARQFRACHLLSLPIPGVSRQRRGRGAEHQRRLWRIAAAAMTTITTVATATTRTEGGGGLWHWWVHSLWEREGEEVGAGGGRCCRDHCRCSFPLCRTDIIIVVPIRHRIIGQRRTSWQPPQGHRIPRAQAWVQQQQTLQWGVRRGTDIFATQTTTADWSSDCPHSQWGAFLE